MSKRSFKPPCSVTSTQASCLAATIFSPTWRPDMHCKRRRAGGVRCAFWISLTKFGVFLSIVHKRKHFYQSKHLKGQLGPRVCHVTFLDQRRSVWAPRLSLNVFGSKEVSWGPASVTSCFWIKGGQLGPRVCHVTFLDQRRSDGASV